MRLLCALLLSLFSCADKTKVSPRTFFDLEAETLAGKQAKMEQYHGKVILVVNTASKCGFTPQYEGLEKLHAELAEQGFSVVGFPSNDFMSQEPGTEDEIREFCTLTYGVKFPMFEKLVVKGENADPFYQELASQGGGEPGWNFHKYLIGKDGKVLQSFGSRVKPDAPELRAAIEAAL